MRLSILSLLSFLLISFSGLSQAPCDEIELDVYVSPLDPSLLVIETNYEGEEFYDYPSFEVYKYDELVGIAETFYFGLTTNQIHTVTLDEPFVDGEEVDLEVVLFTGFGSNEICTMEWTGIPYNSEPCAEVVFWLYIQGTDGEEISISIDNDEGENILTYVDVFNAVNFSFAETLCLPKDCYTLSIYPTDGTFNEQYIASITHPYNLITWQSDLGEVGDDQLIASIEVWEGCVVTVEEQLSESPILYPNPVRKGESVNLSGYAGIQEIKVWSSAGQIVKQMGQSTGSIVFDAAGVFLVRFKTLDGTVHTQRMIVLD